MSPELTQVLRLQSLDTEIGELEREVAALPKHIAEIEKALDSHLRRLEADRAALSANQKERKKLEGDIQVQEQKMSKLRDQMLGAKTNEQYRAFQHEISFCEEQVRKCEDRILDLMGESEPLEKNVKTAELALAEEKRSVEEEKKSARERTAADQKRLAVLRAERAQVVAALPQAVHSAYERIRKRTNGTAIAEESEGRCTACNMALRPQFLQDLHAGSGGIMHCENCKRILYYNPPVSFEHDAASPA